MTASLAHDADKRRWLPNFVDRPRDDYGTSQPAGEMLVQIAWLVRRDVEQGRDEFNLSTWDRDGGEADDAIETILNGSMPLARYVLMHPEARLTENGRRILVDAFRSFAEHDD